MDAFERPQGFAAAGHADYWSRFLSVPGLTGEQRDQPVLEEMERWEENRTGRLPELVANPDRSRCVEDLSVLLSPAAVVELLERIIADRAEESPETWPEHASSAPDPPGIVPVWRILRRKQLSEEDVKRITPVMEASIRRYTPRNLALVRALMAFFFTRPTPADHGLQPLLSEKSILSLRRTLETELARLDADELTQSLQGAHPWALYHCVWGLDRSRRGRLSPPPFEGWPRLAEQLLDALDRAPSVIVPQLVPFLVREDGSRFVFDEAMAKQLFDMDRLRELLRRHTIAGDQVPEGIRERFQALMAALS